MKGRDSKNQYPETIQEKVRAALRHEGKTPVILSEEEMATLGHVRKRAARAIREMCIDCMGGETLDREKEETDNRG